MHDDTFQWPQSATALKLTKLIYKNQYTCTHKAHVCEQGAYT